MEPGAGERECTAAPAARAARLVVARGDERGEVGEEASSRGRARRPQRDEPLGRPPRLAHRRARGAASSRVSSSSPWRRAASLLGGGGRPGRAARREAAQRASTSCACRRRSRRTARVPPARAARAQRAREQLASALYFLERAGRSVSPSRAGLLRARAATASSGPPSASPTARSVFCSRRAARKRLPCRVRWRGRGSAGPAQPRRASRTVRDLARRRARRSGVERGAVRRALELERGCTGSAPARTGRGRRDAWRPTPAEQAASAPWATRTSARARRAPRARGAALRGSARPDPARALEE